MSKEDAIKAIDKKIMMVSVLESPGTILVGLGLYATFGANGNAFHPLLNDPTIVNSMLVLGGAIMALGAFKIFALMREKNTLAKAP